MWLKYIVSRWEHSCLSSMVAKSLFSATSNSQGIGPCLFPAIHNYCLQQILQLTKFLESAVIYWILNIACKPVIVGSLGKFSVLGTHQGSLSFSSSLSTPLRPLSQQLITDLYMHGFAVIFSSSNVCRAFFPLVDSLHFLLFLFYLFYFF